MSNPASRRHIRILPQPLFGNRARAGISLAGARPDARVGTLVDDPEAGLTILYTSGTTGLPKGALISHRAHIARSMVFAAQLALDPGDGFIAWAPMFHMASTDHALATLLRGGTVVMVDGLQSAVINAALSRHKIGWFVMMPGTLEAFIAERRANPLPVKGSKFAARWPIWCHRIRLRS